MRPPVAAVMDEHCGIFLEDAPEGPGVGPTHRRQEPMEWLHRRLDQRIVQVKADCLGQLARRLLFTVSKDLVSHAAARGRKTCARGLLSRGVGG